MLLARKASAGLAAMPRWQGDREREIVRVIDDIGLVPPCYLRMHRDTQHASRVPSPTSWGQKSRRFARSFRRTMISPARETPAR
jgi:hypothetical protein